MNLSGLAEEWGSTSAGMLSSSIVTWREKSGRDPCDFITANIADHGLSYPAEMLAQIVQEALPRVSRYAPDALGNLAARDAIANWYRRRDVAVEPEHIVLTPGTSLGYLYAFRMLLNPGEQVLVPRPSYPLFDDIARVTGVGLRSWHLRRSDRRWELDAEEVRFQLTPATRAIALVSPHNPTGHVANEEELRSLAAICRERQLPLIVDEVFSEFLVGDRPCPRAAEARFDFPLVLTLNGISKMLSLPAWKGAWIGVTGELALVQRLTSALEYMSDTFLPVSELVQVMLPALLRADDGTGVNLCQIIRERQHQIREIPGASVLPAEGGVYLLTPLAAGLDDGLVTQRLIEEQGILTHPGSLYGVDEPMLVRTCVQVPTEEQERMIARYAAGMS